MPMPTIAIINNEPTLLRATACILGSVGYDVRCHSRSDRGLSALLANPADLALIDATNPPLGGIAVLRGLREHTTMRVMFYSAWAHELKERLADSGLQADDYIQIPVARAELLARIRCGVTMGP
jgi:DNA-binding response OmpR family regulator